MEVYGKCVEILFPNRTVDIIMALKQQGEKYIQLGNYELDTIILQVGQYVQQAFIMR